MKRQIIERRDGINYTTLNSPAIEMEYEVVEAVKASNVVIVSGDVGFRKSIQIPKVKNFYLIIFAI